MNKFDWFLIFKYLCTMYIKICSQNLGSGREDETGCK